MRRSLLASLAVLSLAQIAPAQAQIAPYIGQVMAVPFAYCPDHWMRADGRLLKVNDYIALYSLIGNIYGGTAPTDFALPDLRDQPPASGTTTMTYCIAPEGAWPPRS